MQVCGIILAQLVLFLVGEATQWLGEISAGIFAADHEADLARGVGGNGGVCVRDVGEDLTTVLVEAGDEVEVVPDGLACMLNQ